MDHRYVNRFRNKKRARNSVSRPSGDTAKERQPLQQSTADMVQYLSGPVYSRRKIPPDRPANDKSGVWFPREVAQDVSTLFDHILGANRMRAHILGKH